MTDKKDAAATAEDIVDKIIKENVDKIMKENEGVVMDQATFIKTMTELTDQWAKSQKTTSGLEKLEAHFASELHSRPPITTPVTDAFDATKLPNMTLDELRVLRDKLEAEAIKALPRILIPNRRTKFDHTIELVTHRINDFVLPGYNLASVTTSQTETVNGFALFDADKDVVSADEYLRLLKLGEGKYTYSEWTKAMEGVCCTEWHKMDANGESYGGPYWTADEDSDDYKFAWERTFEANCKAMWDLPFAKELLLETIRIGCDLGSESVRWSNWLCVWLARKREAVEKKSAGS